MAVEIDPRLANLRPIQPGERRNPLGHNWRSRVKAILGALHAEFGPELSSGEQARMVQIEAALKAATNTGDAVSKIRALNSAERIAERIRKGRAHDRRPPRVPLTGMSL